MATIRKRVYPLTNKVRWQVSWREGGKQTGASFETKAKAQKTRNLLRDPRATVLLEDGLTYDTLRGVSLEGQAVVVDDSEALWAVGVSVWERYTGPYTDEMRPFVEQMMNNRICVRVVPGRLRSWDHRKLGMGEMPISGSTAQYL
jgi:hypothetical protein